MPIKEITVTDSRGIEVVFIEISDSDGNATAMPKELYDKQQAEQSTPLGDK
jgi:hypothetical protein